MSSEPLTTEWFHVGRPWADKPGLIYAGNEDPHAGRFLLDVGDWSDEIHFGEEQDIDVAAVADHIVALHNSALAAASEEPRPRSDHRPVLRVSTGGDSPQIECSCGWLWNDDDPPDLPEGADFIRHLAALAALPSPRSDDREVTLREAAQRLVDVIFAEAQAEPFVLPLRGMRAASDLRAALHSAPDTVDEADR